MVDNKYFAFKELKVWEKSVDFANCIIDITENLNSKEKHYRLKEQIEASAASIASNIAEGKGRNSKKEFIQYLYIARGSLYETLTFLAIFKNRSWISEDEFESCENKAMEIASMIKGLINSIYNSSKLKGESSNETK